MLRRCAFVAAALAVCGSVYAQTHSLLPAKPRTDALGDLLPDGAIARLGTTRYAHGGKQLLGFSADSKSLLFHGSAALCWMDAGTGKITKVARYQASPTLLPASIDDYPKISNAMLSANGKVLVYAPEKSDGALGIVDGSTGKELRRVKATDVFQAQTVVARADNTQMSADGKLVVTVQPPLTTPQGPVYYPLVWADLSLGQCLYAVLPPKDANWLTAQVSHDGKQIVAMPDQKPMLHFFDTATGKEIRSLSFDQSKLTSFALRGDGKSLDGWIPRTNVVRLYDITDAKELKEIRTLQPVSPDFMVVSRDGKHLYSRSGDKITLWNVDAGKIIRTFEAGLDGTAYLGQLALSPDNKLLAAQGSRAVVVYDLANDRQLTPPTAGSPVALVQFAADGRTLVTGNTRYGNWLWDVQQAKPLRMLARFPSDFPQPFRSDYFLVGMFGGAFSRDGKVVALGLAEGGVHVWESASGKHLYHLPGDTRGFGPIGPPSAVAFAPQGTLLATAGADGMLRIWDSATGKQLRKWPWYETTAYLKPDYADCFMLALAFSPDGRTLAGAGYTGQDGPAGKDAKSTLFLWETASGRERLRQVTALDLPVEGFYRMGMVFDHLTWAMTFSPDGSTLALGGINNLQMIDTVTGKHVRTYSGRQCLGKTATFSKDRKLLFMGRLDGGLCVLDSATGRTLREVAGHNDKVLALALSPDGTILASGSTDTTVLLWDVAEISKPPTAAKADLSVTQLDALWRDLADANAATAYRAIHQLASSPAKAALYLKNKLQPMPAVDPQVLDQLIADLDSDKFQLRVKASSELEKLSDIAAAKLLQRLAQKPSLEMRLRMEKLLAKLQGPITSPEILQALGAIEALERMGTPEAVAVLQVIADGAPGHRVTEDARDAIKRTKGQ